METWPTERPRFLIVGTLLIAAFISASSCLWAQSATTGALRGTVVDPAGAVVPGVTVTLVNPTTGQTQTTMTDAKGFWDSKLPSRQPDLGGSSADPVRLKYVF